MKRSKYRLANRGRKDKPCWTIEDESRGNEYVISFRSKARAEGFLRTLRRSEREVRAGVRDNTLLARIFPAGGAS